MGTQDSTPQMADGFGCPEFFYTHIGKIEQAGGGCMRVYCCIQREGILQPVFTVVMPTEALGIAGNLAFETVNHRRRDAH